MGLRVGLLLVIGLAGNKASRSDCGINLQASGKPETACGAVAGGFWASTLCAKASAAPSTLIARTEWATRYRAFMMWQLRIVEPRNGRGNGAHWLRATV